MFKALKALKKAIFNLEDITITKEMSVENLKEAFHGTFGTRIKIYKSLNTGKGAQVAPDEMILNDLKGEIVFVKNIDNIVPDRIRETTYLYKKVIGGLLFKLQDSTFEYLDILV